MNDKFRLISLQYFRCFPSPEDFGKREATISAHASWVYSIMGHSFVMTRQRKGLVHEIEKLYFFIARISYPNTKRLTCVFNDDFAQRRAHWNESSSINEEYLYLASIYMMQIKLESKRNKHTLSLVHIFYDWQTFFN